MLRPILCFLFLVGIFQASSPCKPFGLRLFYGDVLTDPTSSDYAVLYFDTHNPCMQSYTRLSTPRGKKELKCYTTKVIGSKEMNFYTTYVHQCPLKGIEFDQVFNYSVVEPDSGKLTQQSSQEWIETSLKDPRPEDREFTFIVLGDWGPLKEKKHQYTNIMPYLQQQIKAKKPDAIIIMGDIAYDLDFFNGKQYQDFMKEMALVSCKAPIILVPGNHEHNTQDDQSLMSAGFRLYGMDKDMACGLYIGNSYLVIFDPFDVVYDLHERVKTLKTLKKQLEKSKNTKRFLLTSSHYPLTCSGTPPCPKNYKKLAKHFDLLLEYGSSFYLGAHAHSYQRLYPFYRNASFGFFDPPYESGKGYMVAYVEGVAGNDKNIVMQLAQKREATAAYTVAQTGFSVMECKSDSITYDHYSTKVEGYMDHMLMKKKSKKKILIAEQ